MNYFLSCDWGTTSFRLRLAGIEDGKVLAEEKSDEGIAATFEQWKQSGYPDEKRAGFYLDIISGHIKSLEEKTGGTLKGVKLIISGMASSTIGFIAIPYSLVPLPVDGSGIETISLKAGNGFDHNVLVISGVKTANDVVRGEETQLIGCIEAGRLIKNELFIFPGTHSKHILVKDDDVVDFKTYMTGELFGLLTQKSILKNAVEAGNDDDSDNYLESFKKGVRDAAKTNLLHAVFKVRTNGLFAIYNKTENFNYLSGLLIGAELKDLFFHRAETINLIGGHQLAKYYRTALLELIHSKNIIVLPEKQADEAVVLGQLKIANQLDFFA